MNSAGLDDQFLLSQVPDSPNLEGQVHIFISPRDRVAWLYPEALDSLFVISSGLQGYGGVIQPHLYVGIYCLTTERIVK
jgi:hypothetical protein